LGPSPLNGRFPMVGLLASIYDAVSSAAVRLMDAGERGSEAGNLSDDSSSPEVQRSH
jgi:hypothetical protein